MYILALQQIWQKVVAIFYELPANKVCQCSIHILFSEKYFEGKKAERFPWNFDGWSLKYFHIPHPAKEQKKQKDLYSSNCPCIIMLGTEKCFIQRSSYEPNTNKNIIRFTYQKNTSVYRRYHWFTYEHTLL